MAYPKIIYNPGGGPTTFQFQRFPRKVPAYFGVATRHDNVASSGLRESVLERIDNFLEFEMEWVGIGADVIAWAAFMSYALQGGQFDYYPNSALPGFTTYVLEDTNWKPAYKVPAQYTFSALFRQVPGQTAGIGGGGGVGPSPCPGCIISSGGLSLPVPAPLGQAFAL